jgi:CBS domain-containing protein
VLAATACAQGTLIPSPVLCLHFGLTPVLSCTAVWHQLGMAAAVCCSAGIHRVYVVDPDQRPAGVVTTTDVLQLLSCACSKE